MKYHIKKNWLESADFIRTNPIVLLPFIIIAFLEALSLELAYFSTRYPISFLANPIIRKLFGEQFVHYPGTMVMLPKLFYYSQVAIYIFFSVFMTAIAVNVFKNIKAGLPVRRNAVVKNASKRYLSFVLYGIIVMILLFILKRADMFLFSGVVKIMAKYLPRVSLLNIYPLGVALFLFLTNVVAEVLLLLTIPIMVMEKKALLKAFAKSVYMGIRNFPVLFILILPPFLAYLPVALLKNFSSQLIDKTIPEINLYVGGLGIIISMFVDCFIIVCVSQFLLDKEKKVLEGTV